MVYQLSELENDIKWSTQKTIIFQAGMIKLCNKQANENKGLEERVEKIEKYLKSEKANMMSNGIMQTQRVQSAPTSFEPRTMQQPVSRKQPNVTKKPITRNYSKNSNEYWPEILTDLKQSGKIVLYTNLMNTKAKELNDMTVGIEFPGGMSSFGKTILEKPENIREISKMVSMACGKPMEIKYLSQNNQMTQEENLQQFANDSDIPFNIID